jgi:hypothetical protein
MQVMPLGIMMQQAPSERVPPPSGSGASPCGVPGSVDCHES